MWICSLGEQVVAERSVGLRRWHREGCWRYQKWECWHE